MKREADTKREIVEKRNTNSSSFFFFLIDDYTIYSGLDYEKKWTNFTEIEGKL